MSNQQVWPSTETLGELLFIPNGQEFLAINTSISGGPQSFAWWFLAETQMLGAPEVNHREGLVYFTESGLSRSCGALYFTESGFDQEGDCNLRVCHRSNSVELHRW